MNIKITAYNAICNLGNDIDTIYKNALCGNIFKFAYIDNYIKNSYVYSGAVSTELPQISEKDYDLKCNRLVLKTIEPLTAIIENAVRTYGENRIAIITATTNSGVEEFEKTGNYRHFELGNPSQFLHKHLNLNGYFASVSTACSSGLKAFSLAKDIINSDIAGCAIVISVDTLAKVPLFGFNSLEVLSDSPSLPFGKNRRGMNIGEGCAVFMVEKDSDYGIEIMGIGESSDVYHSTTPDPEAKEAIKAIKSALNEAQITPNMVDYINAHATGTIANDLMEAKAINSIFGESVPVSSTKPLTGHCLGAAAGIETALCCKLLDDFKGRLYPHMYDGVYDESLAKIRLVKPGENFKKCEICMCNSFGFGGTNAILILGKRDEKQKISC